MAKIKFGMIVTDGRGKLGGQVFSKNRSGAYIRTKVTPTNPQTAAQTNVRQSFATLSQAWSTLTASEISAWNGAVKDWATTDIFGDLKNPTGKNLYLRLNQNLSLAGISGLTLPPNKLEMVQGLASSVVIGIAAQTIETVGLAVKWDVSVQISATPTQSGGTSYVKNKLRTILTDLTDNVPAGDVWTAYVNKFGAPVQGDNIFFGFKYILKNGQSSPMQIIKASVVA